MTSRNSRKADPFDVDALARPDSALGAVAQKRVLTWLVMLGALTACMVAAASASATNSVPSGTTASSTRPTEGTPPAGATGVDGLNPSEAVPAWAAHRFVHFDPPLSEEPAPALTSQGSPLGVSPLLAGGKGEALHYDEGPVQTEPQLYLLFWGDNFWTANEPPLPTGLGAELEFFYHDLEKETSRNDAWQGILSQYSNAVGPYHNAKVVAESHVNAISHPKNVTDESIQNEIHEWIANGAHPNANTQFVVLIAPGTNYLEIKGCGYHSVGSYDGYEYSYSVVPYAGDLDKFYESEHKTCDRLKWAESEKKLKEIAQLMFSTTGVASHEFAESTTDPRLFEGAPFKGTMGWVAESGEEIADLCVTMEENKEGHAIEELPEKEGRSGLTYVNKLWDDEGGNTCKLEDPPYSPPPPPTATTEAATGITPSQATFNGTVNPNGPDAHYHFEFGPTTAYGNSTPEVDMGFGQAPVPEAATQTGLNWGTTYHYRIVASNWAGPSYGADHTFTTLFPPPAATISPASEVGPTVATLRGEVSSTYLSPVSYYFEYGLTTGYGTRTAEGHETSFGGGPANVTSAVGGLAPNTTYHDRLVAYTNGGASYSADSTFTTTPSPQAVTEAPTAITGTGATLHAALNPGGHSTTYQFEYWPYGKSGEVKYVPATAESIGAGTSRVSVGKEVSGLVVHSVYNYRVKATSGLGTTYGETLTLVSAPPLTVQSTPNPQGAKEVKLRNISCGSPAACITTGEGENINGLLVERWNGMEWALQTLPHLPESTNINAGPTSCASATACMLLASATKGEVSEQWNGTEWTVTPIAVAYRSEFRSLSCTAWYSCIAVGQYEAEGKVVTLAEHWNGSEWEIMNTPNPSGTEYATLYSVSCTAWPEECTAVGTYNTATGTNTLIERLTLTGWAIQSSPNPSGTKHSLQGVSCTSPKWCIAVGSYGYSDAGEAIIHTLAANWNGTEWMVVPSPNPGGDIGNGSLNSVSCVSPNACTAVGGNLAVYWNGSEWNVESWSKPSGEETSEGYLTAVSCNSATACTGVGSYWNTAGQVTLAEALAPPIVEVGQAAGVTATSATLNGTVNPDGHEITYQFEYGPTKAYGTKIPVPEGKLGAVWHNEALSQTISGLHLEETTYHYRLVATNSAGTTLGEDHTLGPRNWALLGSPDPTGGSANVLNGLSCSSSAACAAIGSYKNSAGTEVPLGEGWNGIEWSLQSTANPTGGTENVLDGVSCSSATACTAVGSYETSNGHRPLIERWNGTAWSIQSAPNPSNASSSFLYGVSCPTASACTAVGYQATSGGYLTLVEQWNGTEWTVQSSPNGTGNYNVLDSVSCTATSACTAVGSLFTGALVERWGGSSWVIQTSLNGSEAEYDGLSGVSCTSATACTAVGWYSKTLFGADYPLAESWNGTAWTSHAVTGSGNLNSVSCSSASACTAVGGILAWTAVAQGWNGMEWTAQVTATPTGAETALFGVSCTSTSACIATGRYANSSKAAFSLIESFGPPIATSEAATSVTTSGATLNASVNPNGKATTYHFEYGTTTSYGGNVPVPDASLISETSVERASQAVSGLAAETTYHYRVVATSGAGVTDGSDLTFKTATVPPENTSPPSISPTTPDQAVPESATTGTWTHNPTSHTYQWQRCNASGGECANISGATSATYTPVEADVEHTLVAKVTATNSAGSNSAFSPASNKVKPVGQITEYASKGEGGPWAVASGPDGNLWATMQNGGAIDKITTSGTVTEYAGIEAATQPRGITAGPDGNLWFTELANKKIGKMNTNGTLLASYEVEASASDSGIIAGPDGNLWYVSYGTNKVGKITASGTYTAYALPSGAKPDDVAKGSDSNLWFTEEGTNKIGKITTSGTVTEYALPSGSEPRNITPGPDGNLWFTDFGTNEIGKITTSGTITEYALASGSGPEGIASGADGNVWFTEHTANKLGRITTSGTITTYTLPSGSEPRDITRGPDDNLWFADQSTKMIGKITP
jgi:streptogramin lyase